LSVFRLGRFREVGLKIREFLLTVFRKLFEEFKLNFVEIDGFGISSKIAAEIESSGKTAELMIHSRDSKD